MATAAKSPKPTKSTESPEPIKSTESPEPIKSVQTFADDWNKTTYKHQLMIFPRYEGRHLLEVRVNLNTHRFYTGDYQWHELLAKGEKALPIFASLESDRTDFAKGMINVRVNSTITRYREKYIVNWLVWLTAEFLPTIQRR